MPPSSLQEKFDTLANSFHPYAAHWEVTAHCNASCGYCYVRDNHQPDLATGDMLRIADALAENGILTLTVSGGEAFLRPDILTILQRVIDNDFFSISLFTNATLLTPRHLDFLIRNKKHIQSIQFSAFSHHAEVNDRYMGVPGALEKILNCAHTLQSAGIRVVIVVNILDFNLSEFSQTRAFFINQNIEVNASIIKLVSPQNRCGVPEEMFSEEYFRNCFRQIDAVYTEEVRSAMSACIQGTSPTRQLCAGIKTFLGIDHRGDIRPCPLFTDMIVGNALEPRSFASMLRSSEAYSALRRMTIKDLPECRDCRFINYCPICLGARVLEHGDYLIPDRQRCNLAKAAYAFTTGSPA